ncbi:MAG: hypothetical protein AB1746_15945, partial [Candidatus Zixiibacteriota bacterium]
SAFLTFLILAGILVCPAHAMKLKRGDKIKIIDSLDHVYEGSLMRFDSNSVTLRILENQQFQVADIKSISVWKSNRVGPRTNGYLIGFGAGVAYGLLLGRDLRDTFMDKWGESKSEATIQTVLIYSFFMGGIGAVIGSLSQGYEDISMDEFLQSKMKLSIKSNSNNNGIQVVLGYFLN